MNSNAMSSSPPTDADFAFAPMSQPYLGFDAGMPSLERPLLQQQQQQHSNLIYDSNFDFPNSSFSFQDPSSLLPPTTMPSMAMGMGMAMPSSLQMPPLMTLPGVPTAELYHHPFGGGPSSSSFLKREDGGRIGLNLGRRTYFSPVDVLAVDRLLNRSRLGGVGLGLGMAGVLGLGLGAAHHHQQPPRCQAEGCKADLSAAKHYHRRHKVCEYHAKAAAVAAGGKQQRFCQQCSRYASPLGVPLTS